MTHIHKPPLVPAGPAGMQPAGTGPAVHFAQKQIWLGGVISTRAEAEEFIATINALKPMLKADDTAPAASTALVPVPDTE